MRLWALSALLVAGTVSSTALAQNDNIVALVTKSDSALTDRLAQEMNLAGLDVEWSRTDPPNGTPKLIIVVPDDPEASIEIWTVTDGASSLAASVPPDGSEDSRALRVAELARALVFNPAQPPEPPPDPPDAPPARPKRPKLSPVSPKLDSVVLDPKPAKDAPAAGDFGVAAGLGLQAQGISMQIEATATYWPHGNVGVGFFGSAPAVAATITETEGSAAVRCAIFGAELATAPLDRSQDYVLLLNPGVGLAYLHVSGTADLPHQSLEAAKALGAAYGRAEVRVRIAGPLRVKVSALAGAAFPAVDIEFAQRVVSTFSPFGAASLGLTVEP